MPDLASSALAALAHIEQELTSGESYVCQLRLTRCGQEKTEKLLAAVRGQSQNYSDDLSELCSLSHELMKDVRLDPTHCLLWRSLYSDSALVWSLLDIVHARELDNVEDDEYWKASVKRLDNAIIIAGAPGESRLDLILDTIERIQSAHLPLTTTLCHTIIPHIPKEENHLDAVLLPSATHPVPVLSRPPSISAFRSRFGSAPFILRQYAADWPAMKERLWASKAYLQSVAGRGRVVPVEIGRDYRTDDWTQRMIEWDDFLDYLFANVEADREADNRQQALKEVRYLAQHDLFKQFAALREDVVVPDYVYTCLPPPEHYPQYRPPANDEQLVINTWIGPAGTLSPAHIDPFYNFYTQVVGKKTVWLAPPNASRVLSPHPARTASSSEHRTSSDLTTPDSKENSAILSNTTHLDVFASASELQCERGFMETVAPLAMSAVLDEGDMLFFPPGWWHALRSESISFSVSMWF
ncbi:hypothetical protein ACEPAH_5104 [Sanghuangporus vaninii]